MRKTRMQIPSCLLQQITQPQGLSTLQSNLPLPGWLQENPWIQAGQGSRWCHLALAEDHPQSYPDILHWRLVQRVRRRTERLRTEDWGNQEETCRRRRPRQSRWDKKNWEGSIWAKETTRFKRDDAQLCIQSPPNHHGLLCERNYERGNERRNTSEETNDFSQREHDTGFWKKIRRKIQQKK